MQRISRGGWRVAMGIAAALAVCGVSASRAPAQFYRFVGGSALVDSCPICGRPDIIRPVHGSLWLRLAEETPIERRFAVEALQFTTDDGLYAGAGRGSLTIRSIGPAEFHHWEIEAEVFHDGTATPCALREVDAASHGPFPMLDVVLEQTNGTPTRVYRLILDAAPFAAMWFSTRSGFTPGSGGGYVPGGTLLSDEGRIVRKNGRLLEAFGVGDDGLAAGLDAVDVLPGGRIAFSIDLDVRSERLGTLHHGDVLLEEGRILRTFEELLAPFSIQPPLPALGLDAVQVLDDGEILFSVGEPAFSEKLGTEVGPGDLLSSQGRIVLGHEELLARFHPAAGTPADVGLDAFHLWPYGEVWFSVEQAFDDEVLGFILPGHLLSSRGTIVFRNLDLMQPFMPLEDLADFGLDALFLAVGGGAGTGPSVSIEVVPGSGDVLLDWDGGGRVFQVERAEDPAGPFEAVTPLTTSRAHSDPQATMMRPRAFYRVRQW